MWVDVGNRLEAAGINFIMQALIHPDGLNHLTSLDLQGERAYQSRSAEGVAETRTMRWIDNGVDSQAIALIKDAFIHPNGPKNLKSLNLAGSLTSPQSPTQTPLTRIHHIHM